MSSGTLDETVPASSGQPGELVPGMRLGRYRLDRVIGSGGMGVVWAAYDFDLDRAIALKLIKLGHDAPALRARLQREARAMARLKHPNVLTVYEVGSAGDRDFIAMELVEGGSLEGWLHDNPPPAQIYAALLGAGHGLAAAHAAGLVHRDFKPHNVLRRTDGRVLVTDFGLARGLGEETGARVPLIDMSASNLALDETAASPALAETLAPSDAPSQRSTLDGTLTQTGVLIGTPAYMAPEQFTGSPCDARSDQFAFCVTAWQALTGERPFQGSTIAELHAATLDGAGGAPCSLQFPVRRVLVRGLEPEPANRWPDLDSLLRALDRARFARRRKLMALGAGLAAIAVALAIYLAGSRGETAGATGPCADPEAQLAIAWSDAAHQQLVRGAPALEPLAGSLDRFGRSWLAAYRAVCARPPGKVYAHAGCLLGVRDAIVEVRALVTTLGRLPPHMSPAHLLPDLEMCTGSVPIAPPAAPDPIRDRVRALRAQAIGLLSERGDLRAATDALVAAARPLEWRPIVAEILMFGASAAEARDELDLERELLRRTITEATLAHDPFVENGARVTRLALDLDVQDDPNDPGEFAQLLREATDAIRSNGDSPVGQATVRAIEANRLAAQHRPAAVLAMYDGIIDTFATQGDLVRAAIVARAEVAALLAIDGPGMRARADAVVARLFEKVRAASDQVAYDTLVDVRRELAWRAQRLDDAHADDRVKAPPPTGELARGRVVDPSGTPVADAIVVAWRGVLGGDAHRVYTRRAGFEGDVTTTAADGTFALRVPPRGAIIAERGPLRSRPVLAAGTLELALAPTQKLEGVVHSIDTPTTGVDACAWYALDDETAWVQDIALGERGAYVLENLPAGTPRRGARREGHRVLATAADIAEINWAIHTPLDVIVRNGDPDLAVYVLRRGAAPKTPAELAAVAFRADDVAWAPVTRVGAATATDAGRALRYTRDDVHAVLDGIAPGIVTICVAGKEVACHPYDMLAGTAAPVDGHVYDKAEAALIALPPRPVTAASAPVPSDGR